MMEDEGLSRLSQTVWLLVELADLSQQPPKPPDDQRPLLTFVLNIALV